jgi:acetoin utilization deacetylase AcuC-like enzyme
MATVHVADSRFDAHTMQGHPEFAGRLVAIRQRLAEDRLTDRLVELDPQPAADDSLLAVHTAHYLELLAATSRLEHTEMMGLDTYVTPGSFEIARLAAGGVLQAVDAVMSGKAENGLAAVRPPGHHATPSMGMGFCLLNNIAIAARHAQRQHGVKRVLIADYDVHHGNGTQDAFYTDPTVLYISTHQSPLYPGTGMIQDTGESAGTGYTLNIPLPPGVGDQGYARVFEEVVIPAARRFAPELILVSAGFDAHWDDSLANMQLSLTGYDHLTRQLLALAGDVCNGRIVFVLEGGYNLEALSYAWANVARALLGDSTCVDPLGPAPRSEPSVEHVTQRIRQLHKLT